MQQDQFEFSPEAPMYVPPGYVREEYPSTVYPGMAHSSYQPGAPYNPVYQGHTMGYAHPPQSQSLGVPHGPGSPAPPAVYPGRYPLVHHRTQYESHQLASQGDYREMPYDASEYGDQAHGGPTPPSMHPPPMKHKLARNRGPLGSARPFLDDEASDDELGDILNLNLKVQVSQESEGRMVTVLPTPIPALAVDEYEAIAGSRSSFSNKKPAGPQGGPIRRTSDAYIDEEIDSYSTGSMGRGRKGASHTFPRGGTGYEDVDDYTTPRRGKKGPGRPHSRGLEEEVEDYDYEPPRGKKGLLGTRPGPGSYRGETPRSGKSAPPPLPPPSQEPQVFGIAKLKQQGSWGKKSTDSSWSSEQRTSLSQSLDKNTKKSKRKGGENGYDNQEGSGWGNNGAPQAKDSGWGVPAATQDSGWAQPPAPAGKSKKGPKQQAKGEDNGWDEGPKKPKGKGKSKPDADGESGAAVISETAGGKSDSGWGVAKPKEDAGWGVANPKEDAGWGTPKPKEDAGWGAPKPKEDAGWGAPKPKEDAGWGAPKPKEDAGWDAPKPKEDAGWGIPEPEANSGGWGATGRQGTTAAEETGVPEEGKTSDEASNSVTGGDDSRRQGKAKKQQKKGKKESNLVPEADTENEGKKNSKKSSKGVATNAPSSGWGEAAPAAPSEEQAGSWGTPKVTTADGGGWGAPPASSDAGGWGAAPSPANSSGSPSMSNMTSGVKLSGKKFSKKAEKRAKETAFTIVERQHHEVAVSPAELRQSIDDVSGELTAAIDEENGLEHKQDIVSGEEEAEMREEYAVEEVDYTPDESVQEAPAEVDYAEEAVQDATTSEEEPSGLWGAGEVDHDATALVDCVGEEAAELQSGGEREQSEGGQGPESIEEAAAAEE